MIAPIDYLEIERDIVLEELEDLSLEIYLEIKAIEKLQEDIKKFTQE